MSSTSRRELTDDELARVAAMASTGRTQTEIAERLDMERSTFRRIRDRDPRVKAALETGLDEFSIATELDDTTYALIEKMARNGVEQHGVARHLGMSWDAWVKLRDTEPLVQECFDAGRASLGEKIVGILAAKALDGEVVPAIFLLKCMFGFRENAPVQEHHHKLTIELPKSLTPDEYARLSQEKPKAIDAEVVPS